MPSVRVKMAPLVTYAVSTAGVTPSLLNWNGGGFGGVGERFPNEGRGGRREDLKDRAAATFAAPPKLAWAR